MMNKCAQAASNLNLQKVLHFGVTEAQTETQMLKHCEQRKSACLGVLKAE
jgi:hypothetical protein